MPLPAKQYYSIIVAALVVITGAVISFIYSILYTTPADLVPIAVEVLEDGTTTVNPGGVGGPDGPPDVTPPTYPPPSE